LVDVARNIRCLRKFKFEAAIDLQGLLKSAMIARLSGAARRWGFSRELLREPAGRFFLTDSITTAAQQHVIRKNLTLALAAIGDELSADEPIEFPITTSDEHRDGAAAIAAEAGHRFAVLNPGGGWVTKLWPAENFGALADLLWERYGLASVVTGGPGDEILSKHAAAKSRSGQLVTASPGLKTFYELARLASIYVGGDTGPTHLAVAAGASVVGLFGPTEWWRNGSINPDDMCVERTDIGCRTDCHRRTCGEWICMDISVERVANAVGKRLALQSAKSR
jgi:heptosyltransferase I